jgi:hypothetical protein
VRNEERSANDSCGETSDALTPEGSL